jgi:hypothetical protein
MPKKDFERDVEEVPKWQKLPSDEVKFRIFAATASKIPADEVPGLTFVPQV